MPERRLFTVDEYDRMVELGIIGSGEKVELIDGEIVCMAAMGARHIGSTSNMDDGLRRSLPPIAAIRIQAPIRLPPRFEPEPDLAVVRKRPDNYIRQHPGP